MITMSMLRGEPTKTSTMIATSVAAMTASRTTSHSALRTNCDWSNAIDMFIPAGAVAMIEGIRFLTLLTTAIVEAAACLMIAR